MGIFIVRSSNYICGHGNTFLVHKNKGCIARALVPMHKIPSPPLLLPKLQKKNKPAWYKVTHFPKHLWMGRSWWLSSLSVCKRSLNGDELAHHGGFPVYAHCGSAKTPTLHVSDGGQLLCTSGICTELLLTWLKRLMALVLSRLCQL